MQLVSEKIMEHKMATNSHSIDSRGSERGHNRRVKEDAKENSMRNKFTVEEYWKEVVDIWEQFNKLELMIKEIQRVGRLMKIGRASCRERVSSPV